MLLLLPIALFRLPLANKRSVSASVATIYRLWINSIYSPVLFLLSILSNGQFSKFSYTLAFECKIILNFRIFNWFSRLFWTGLHLQLIFHLITKVQWREILNYDWDWVFNVKILLKLAPFQNWLTADFLSINELTMAGNFKLWLVLNLHSKANT